jgi:RNA polymerase sigma factor (sigma-70 family)
MTAATGVAPASTHEELFLERYDQLLKWAIQLSRPDSELAKDLVQEAFLQFASSDGNRTAINNIDNYLYGVVRNTYLSYLRRSPWRFQQPLDADANEKLTLAIDPRGQINAKDDLLAICERVCVRKETSVAASLLILRFFHGYLPDEIAKLTNRSRNVIDVHLKLARCEAMASEARNKPIRKPQKSVKRKVSMPRLQVDLLTELRIRIFASRHGECFDDTQLKCLKSATSPVPRAKLSHLVSCSKCLHKVSVMLGLPSLKERNAFDLFGRSRAESQDAVILAVIRKTICLVTGWSLWSLLASSDLFF